MQFCARFGLSFIPGPTKDMLTQCIGSHHLLPIERIWCEWEKLLTKGNYPIRALEFLENTNAIVVYPELSILRVIDQNIRWHPEGNVWEHTKLAFDKTVGLSPAVKLAVLCHDMGKVTTTLTTDNYRAPGHAKAGIGPANKFMDRIMMPDSNAEMRTKVLNIVRYHMSQT